MEQRAVTRVWCVRNEALLLHRAAVGARRLAELHELPAAEHLGFAEDKFNSSELIATKRRGITRFQITESIYAVKSPRGKLHPELVWVPLAALDEVTFSGPHRRWITEILAKQPSGS
jgi:A/G-specific adenine glycosylase